MENDPKAERAGRFNPRALLAGNDLEGHSLSFLETAAAIHVDGGVMHKDIVFPLAGDEAEAFFIVEPLNNTRFQLV